MFLPRPSQQSLLAYRRGTMGVSAVPGSGKTQTLYLLAAELIISGVLTEGQEILIVTLVNSAVDNFTQRIAAHLVRHHYLPHMGYRVRTLHGLAHDILRENPAPLGLPADFHILDEHLTARLRAAAVHSYLRAHPNVLDAYLLSSISSPPPLSPLLDELASAIIRTAKDLTLKPSRNYCSADIFGASLPLAEVGAAIYADYQRALVQRGALDFDDLISLALHTLQLDDDYLTRLRQRWPYILEDEAQDSSRLQEQMLRLLAGSGGNWVRVGDPNQAIYETFTTANPQYLRNFLREAESATELPESGRSTQSIIALANHLIHLTQTEHPLVEVRAALAPPFIQPAPVGDPQSNPVGGVIHFVSQAFTPDEELSAIANSLARWLPEHAEDTVAVLLPRNQQGFELVNELKRRNLETVELLRSAAPTREAAAALADVLKALADPASPGKLATAYKAWRRAEWSDPITRRRITRVAAMLQKCRRVEDFLYPQAESNWLNESELKDELLQFRDLLRRWHAAAPLPIDQLLLTLAQDLFREPTDLALTHKLIALLGQAKELHPHWQLDDFALELIAIARNERRFLGFSAEDTGFDPEQYRGKVVVSTLHKAKGLEWDRVYLASLNDYDFPSGLETTRQISEPWFVREGLNLRAEALAQLQTVVAGGAYREAEATRKAHLDYISEHLRLFYVGLTRAKRDLILTWNSGRNGEQQPALAFLTLRNFWQQQ